MRIFTGVITKYYAYDLRVGAINSFQSKLCIRINTHGFILKVKDRCK